MMKIDSTQLSVVVKCTDCPHWYGFGFDRLHAWRVAREHELRVHPGATQAATALAKAEKMARRIHG